MSGGVDVRPFRALRYDPKRVDLARVLVPPYDVIAAGDRARLWERDPHSAIRLELTRDVGDEAGTDYSEVRRELAAWREQGVLRRDPEPAYYALRQRFRAPDGEEHVRLGFFGLLRLEDYGAGRVRPHERTLAGPKADRLKILRATRANLSSVFFLYEDRGDRLPGLLDDAFERALLLEARDEAGSTHTLARVTDPAAVARLAGFMAERPVVIADGHHRYETALAYRDEVRAAAPQGAAAASAAGVPPSEQVLGYFANAFAPGTLLLPIHRLVRKGSAPSEAAWRERLPGWTQSSLRVDDVGALPELLARHLAPLRDRFAFAADDASGVLRVFSRARGASEDLSVRVIHREVIEGVFGLDEDAVREGAIAYPKDTLQTARDLRTGDGCVALYLNPLDPADVFAVTARGEVLPQKSTFFFPKLPTGLLFRLLDEGAS